MFYPYLSKIIRLRLFYLSIISLLLTSCINRDLDFLYETEWYEKNSSWILNKKERINPNLSFKEINRVIWFGKIKEIKYDSNEAKYLGYVLLEPVTAVSYVKIPKNENSIKLLLYREFPDEIPKVGEEWAFLSISSEDDIWFVYDSIRIDPKGNDRSKNKPNVQWYYESS